MVVHINKTNFDKEVTKASGPVILDFWASWCGPCQMMGPVFEELSKAYKGKLKFGKVNTEEEPELANSFAIQGIPCLVVVENGSEIGRIVGFLAKDALQKKIDGIIG